MFRERRRGIVNIYNEAFSSVKNVKTPFESTECDSNFHLYVLLFDFEKQAIVEQNKKDIAAVIMEPIRNVHPQPGFLEGVRALADEMGAVSIIDEISAAFRMNSGGTHLLLGVEPDMAVFSKALGNGYPVAAIIGKADIMQAAQNTFISSTNWTERIGPTAALATIKKHKAVDAGKHLMAIGKQVQEGWALQAKKNNLKIDIGGIPPLSHFSFEYDNALSMKAYFIQLMLEQGFPASNLLYAMYAHTENHVRSYLEEVDKSFEEVARSIEHNDIDKKLIDKPSSIGFKRLA